jgi:glycosyltransferase involved in cell wall biosynthesis
VRKLNVLHIVSHLHHGGLERVVSDLVTRTDRTRFNVAVLCLGEVGVLGETLNEQFPNCVQPMSRQSKLSLIRPVALARRLRDSGADIAHCHTGVWLKSARAARRAGIQRVVYTEHGRRRPDPLSVRVLDRLAARSTDVVVVVSPDLEGYMRESVVGPVVPIRTIYNGIDVERFRPDQSGRADSRRELGLEPGAFVVGSLGRLVEIKCYDRMVRAFGLFRDMWDGDAHLVIGGEGPDRQALTDLRNSLGLQGQVHFLGWRTDTENVLPALDVFSLSSRSEGTSIGLLEAMAAGCAPVVTRVGGTPAVLGRDLEDCLVPFDDEQAMAERWHSLATSPDALSTRSVQARRRVANLFSLPAMITAYENLYSAPRI